MNEAVVYCYISTSFHIHLLYEEYFETLPKQMIKLNRIFSTGILLFFWVVATVNLNSKRKTMFVQQEIMR